MNLALYFGSFDPVHIGHLIIANHILNFEKIDKLWFVVSPQNPFKTQSSLLNEYNRLHLIRLAIEKDPRLSASSVEFNLPKPSYTVDTLAYLHEKYPEDQFSIIMGSDSFQDISKWKNAHAILKNYPILVYHRSGFDVDVKAGTDIKIVEAPRLEISSTQIREFIKKGKSIRYLVPEKVRVEIEKSHYYK